LDMGEEQFVAKLAHGGNSLVWDDGDVWLRSSYRPRGIVKSEQEKRPRAKRSGRPPKRRRVHFNREPQVRRFVSIEPWDLEFSDEESSDDYGYGYGYNSDDDDPYEIRSPSDYDDTLEVSDSEIQKSDQQQSVGGGMFSPSTDALSMSDSSTVTSSGNGGGLHLHSANALRSPQYAEQWASQDSIQSTGGLYTPSIDSTSAAPNEYMTYPPLPSSTSNPTVDTTLTSVDSNRGNRHSTISTHTSDADFDRFNSETSFFSDQSDAAQFENVFENVKNAQKGSISVADHSDSNISVGSASGISPALHQHAQVAPSLPRLDSDRHLKGSETSMSEYENVFENMHKLQSPNHLQDRDIDESSEDSSTSDELGEWPPRCLSIPANPNNPVSNNAPSPLDSKNKRTMAGGGRRFNSIIIKHQEGPQHYDFKKFESNFRLGIQLKRRPRPHNTHVGSPRARKEVRQQRILQRQATPYHSATSPSSTIESSLENERPLILGNTQENSHIHESLMTQEITKKLSLKESKAVITRAQTQMQEATTPLLEPTIASFKAPKRAATSDRLMMSAQKTMLQAYNLLRKKKKKRFSLGVRKAASEQVFSPEAVSPLDVDPTAPVAREMQKDSPVTGTLSPRFNIATIPATVEIINSPLKSTTSTEIERRTMISYASVASAADSDEEEENEPPRLVDKKTPDENSAYLIQTTSSFLEETSEHNIYTEESDSFSLEEGVDEDLSNSGSSAIAASLISASKNNSQKKPPSKKSKLASSGGKSRKKKKKARRSFNLGAKRSIVTPYINRHIQH